MNETLNNKKSFCNQIVTKLFSIICPHFQHVLASIENLFPRSLSIKDKTIDMSNYHSNLEMINYLQKLEDKNYNVCDYIQFVDMEARCLLESRRIQLCSWMYRFVDSCNLCRGLVSHAMSYFDRFLTEIIIRKDFDVFMCRSRVTESSFLQLAALIALNLAIKLHSKLKWNLKHMIKVSRGMFDLTELIDMERRMLYVLAWRLNPPTSAEFVMHLASLLFNIAARPEVGKYFDDIVDTAIFFTELAVWDSYFLECKAITLAIASLLNAVESFDRTHKFIDMSALTSFTLILESMDLIPNKEILDHVRSRVHEVFSRSEYSEEVTSDTPEQSITSPRIFPVSFSQNQLPIAASR